MKSFALVLAFIGLTVLSWGVYGPVLHDGQLGMGGGRLRPFICVGVAYFLIAVVVPTVLLRLRGEGGNWTAKGIVWSLAGGAAGAIGALGIIMAFNFGGSPVYVMPLVFGCAPVVNTFTTMYMGRSFRQAGPMFYAGMILVAVGAVTVMVFKPSAAATHSAPAVATAEDPAPQAASATKKAANKLTRAVQIGMSIAAAFLFWGVYGPVLHKGQANMHGSRMRPLICVGLAYFVIAVLVPAAFLARGAESGPQFTFGMDNLGGATWSLIAGAAGAVGALGIIMAFDLGGKPIYVMPLVFGGAPVVNTFVTILGMEDRGAVSPIFYAGLIMVVAGAVTVLVFVPKGAGKPSSRPKKVAPPSSQTEQPA